MTSIQAGLFESLDEMRRSAGRTLDRFDLGPRECAFDIVFSRPAARLRAYGAPQGSSPVLFIVPAPIKGPYIWDLLPERSVVRKALDRGFEVYLVEWTRPGGDEARLGLEDYALTALGECVDAIRSRSHSEQVLVAGHSLGGTFAGLYAAYRPEQIRGLVLIEAPMHFAEASGAFKPMLDAGIPTKAILQSSDRVPGSLLNLLSVFASPKTFQFERCVDFIASLASPADFETHCRVERWTLDELPLPRALFEDVVERLFREDRFMRGDLVAGNRRLDARDVRSPVFAVYDPDSLIIPPDAILEFMKLSGSDDKEALPYSGDTGIALRHVGALVGKSAHRQIWPRIFDWLERIAAQ